METIVLWMSLHLRIVEERKNWCQIRVLRLVEATNSKVCMNSNKIITSTLIQKWSELETLERSSWHIINTIMIFGSQLRYWTKISCAKTCQISMMKSPLWTLLTTPTLSSIMKLTMIKNTFISWWNMSKACPCTRKLFSKKIRHSQKREPPDIWSNFSKQLIIATRKMWSTEILNQTISWLLSKTPYAWSILVWHLRHMLEKVWHR